MTTVRAEAAHEAGGPLTDDLANGNIFAQT